MEKTVKLITKTADKENFDNVDKYILNGGFKGCPHRRRRPRGRRHARPALHGAWGLFISFPASSPDFGFKFALSHSQRET